LSRSRWSVRKDAELTCEETGWANENGKDEGEDVWKEDRNDTKPEKRREHGERRMAMDARKHAAAWLGWARYASTLLYSASTCLCALPIVLSVRS